ncbi:MAG: transporter substrate-binding domain-containing protein [Polyangiales bacterium]
MISRTHERAAPERRPPASSAWLVVARALGWGAAVAFLAPCGCAPDDSIDRVQREGTLRVGYAVEAPYAFVDAQGRATGESPEVARRVAESLGIRRVVWVQTQFARLIPDLESGRFDVIASGLFVTRERARRVAFSRPTFRVAEGLLVRSKDVAPPTTCRALAGRPDARVAVISGAVEHDRLRACGVRAGQIVTVPDAAAGRAAVATGVVLGLALSLPTLRWMAATDPARRATAVPFAMGAPTWSYGAFAFRRHDRSLRVAWDAALARFLGSPSHASAVAAFGFGPEERADLAAPEDAVAR